MEWEEEGKIHEGGGRFVKGRNFARGGAWKFVSLELKIYLVGN